MIRKILRSTASNSFHLLVVTVITFVMTPIYLRELGDYDYGIWEVIMSVIGYLGLIDLGLRPTISRFTAYHAYNNKDDKKDHISIFNTSLVMMCIAGFIAATALFIWSVSAPYSLAPEDGDSARYALVLQLIAARLLLSFPFFSMESTLEGRLFYATKNNISIFLTIVGASFLYVYLPYYDALVLLSLVTVAQAAIKLCILYLLLRLERYGGYRIRLGTFDIGLALEMLRFGAKSLTQGVAAQITTRTDPVVIAGVMGPQFVVFYSLPYALVSRTASLNVVLTQAMMPAFSQLYSSGDQRTLEKYFLFGSKLAFSLKMAICVGVAALGENFISLWISPSYGDAAQEILLIMVLAAVAGGTLPLHNRLLMAMNKHGRLATIYVGRALLNLALTIALVFPLGLKGVVLATLLAQLAALPFVWKLVFSNISITPLQYIVNSMMPSVASALGMGAIVVLLESYLIGADSWSSLSYLVVAGIIAHIVLSFAIGFSKEEINSIRRLVRRGV